MKSYIYTRSEGKPPRDGSGVKYTLKLYRIVRGSPVYLGKDVDSFCSDFQQCRDLMKKLGEWPKAADAVGADGRQKYYYPEQLREAGIVNINQI